jgi:DNA mismatch repair protein MutS2
MSANLRADANVLAGMRNAVTMDAHTLELLEFHKVRDLAAGYAYSTLAKDLARLAEPGTDIEAIRAELALVSEMVEVLGEDQAPPFAGLSDVRLLARRAAIGSMLSAEELLEVAQALNCTGHMYRYRMRLGSRFQKLIELLTPVEDLGPVAKSIAGCIDSRAHVLDMASQELTHIRHQLATLEERVQMKIKGLLRDPELRKVLRFPNVTVSGDHFVLPVSINFRHKVPGLVHRTSSTGETIYIEPAAIANLSAERVVLKGDEDREIRRVLRRLSGEVGRVARPLSLAIETIARLDHVTAKARFSRDFGMTCPTLSDDGRLWLRQARHPLLEHLFRAESVATRQSAVGSPTGDSLPPAAADCRLVVPIDVRLGHAFNLLVITGPNTGGKTVTLKTTGLLCLMAQAGMHIPAADGSTVPIFQQILADIGDEQSLEQSLSTFSSHVSRIAGIVTTADAHSLVLLDELGAGTDPTEGAALGRAILDELDHLGCRAMVTTHLGDLKTYAFSNPRAENAAVEFDIETLRPTYRLHIGQFGMSNALKIARRLKLPRELLKRAHRYLRRKQRKSSELMQLQRQREETEKARAEALLAQHEAAKQREEYQAKTAKLQREAEESAALREARARLQTNDPVHVPRFDKMGRIVRVDHKRNMAVVSVGLGQWEVPLDEVFPRPSEPNGA